MVSQHPPPLRDEEKDAESQVLQSCRWLSEKWAWEVAPPWKGDPEELRRLELLVSKCEQLLQSATTDRTVQHVQARIMFPGQACGHRR